MDITIMFPTSSLCRFLVFIKLSFGMGLIWSMEIVSGVLGDDVDEAKWWVNLSSQLQFTHDKVELIKYFLWSNVITCVSYFRYFTDILNMLQGVYIFLIFVCKRNVYEVTFGRKDKNDGGEKNATIEMKGKVPRAK